MHPAAGLPNPFDADVVSSPGQRVVIDVREIHRRAFERCRAEYEMIGRQSRAMLFHGEAGCGKTHLLSRFRRWLSGEIDTPPAAPPAIFVAVRMETAPGQVWRHLQRRFAEQLLERSANAPPALDGVLERFAQRQHKSGLAQAFEATDIPDLNLNLAQVLEHYAEGKHRRPCRAWLKGEPLADRDLELLGLSSRLDEELDDESGEYGAQRFVLAMTRICAPEPVVFCFDQLEALSLSSAANSYGPFAKMGASLIDETSNSLVISSILSQYIPELEKQSMESDLDRIRKVIVDLHPLDPVLGAKLIEARLDAVEQLRPQRPRGGIEPLRQADVDGVFAANHGNCTARKLIHEARRLFELWRGQEPPESIPAPEFLGRRFARYRETSAVRGQPAWADEILEHGLAAIAHVAGRRVTPGAHKHIDFEAESAAGNILISLCNQSHATALANKLKRLSADLDADAKSRLCLIRDPRLVISPKAKVTRQRLAGLQAGGARLLRPGTEALAAIDAMKRLLAEAASGDLTHQGEAVAPGTVRDWLSANLPGAVRDFLDELAGPGPAPRDDSLVELLREAKVLSTLEAARRLGWTLNQVECHARENPDSIGFVAGPAAVVFDVGFAPVGGSDRYA